MAIDLKAQELQIKLELLALPFLTDLSKTQKKARKLTLQQNLLINKDEQRKESEYKKAQKRKTSDLKKASDERERILKDLRKTRKKLQDDQEREDRAALNRRVQAFKRAHSKIMSMERRLSGALGGMAKGAAMGGLFAGGAAVAGVMRAGMNFETSMSTIKAVSMATDAEMASIEKQARLLGKTTAFTATEVANGMIELSRAGLSTKQILESIAPSVYLAGATNYGLAKSTKAVVSAMKQFNVKAENSGHIANVFAEATRRSLLDMSSLNEAMKYAGTVGAGFNMTLEATVAGVAAFRNMGLEGSLAGTNFRMAMASAAKATKRKSDVLKDLNLTYKDINPESNTFFEILKKVGEAGASVTQGQIIFGQRAGANVITLSRNVIKLQEFKKGLTGVNKATGKLYTQLEKDAAIQKFTSGMTDLEEIQKLLEESSKDGGTALQMYDDSLKNVAGQGRIAFAALSELGLMLYHFIKVPIREFLTGLVEVFDEMSMVFDELGNILESNLKVALDEILVFLHANSEIIARGIVGGIREAIKFIRMVINNMSALSSTVVAAVKGLLGFVRIITGVATKLSEMGVTAEGLAHTLFIMWGTGRIVAFTNVVYTAGKALATASVSAGKLKTAMLGVRAATGLIGAALTGALVMLAKWNIAADKAAQRAEHLRRMTDDERQQEYQKEADDIARRVSGTSAVEIPSWWDETMRAQYATEIVQKGGRGRESRINLGSGRQKQSIAALQEIIKVDVDGERMDAFGTIDDMITRAYQERLEAILGDEELLESLKADKAGGKKILRDVADEVMRGVYDEYTTAVRNIHGDEGAMWIGAARRAHKTFLDTSTGSMLFDVHEALITKMYGQRDLMNEARSIQGFLDSTDYALLRKAFSGIKKFQARSNKQLEDELAAAEALEEDWIETDTPTTTTTGGDGPVGDPDDVVDTLKERQRILKQMVSLWEKVNKLQETRLNQEEIAELKRQASEEERRLKTMSMYSTEYETTLQKINALTREIELHSDASQEKIDGFTRKIADIKQQVEESEIGEWADVLPWMDYIQPGMFDSADSAELAAAVADDVGRADDKELIELIKRYIELVNQFPEIIAAGEAEATEKGLKKEEELRAAKEKKVKTDLMKLLAESDKELLTEVEQILQERDVYRSGDAREMATEDERARIEAMFQARLDAARLKEKEEKPTLKQRLQEKFPKLTKAINKVVKIIKKIIDVIQKIISVISTVSGKFFEVFGISGGWRGVAQQAMAGGGPDVVAEKAATLTEGINRLATGFPAILSIITDEMKSLSTILLRELPNILSTLITEIPEFVATILDMFPALIDSLVGFIPQVVSFIPQILDVLLDKLPAILRSLLSGVVTLIMSVAKILPDLVVSIVDALPAIIHEILLALPDIIAALIVLVGAIIEAILKAIPGIIKLVAEVVPDIILMIIHLLPTIGRALMDVMVMITRGIWDGLVGTLQDPEFWQEIGANIREGWQNRKGLIGRLKERTAGDAAPALQSGTPLVRSDGLFYLHKGEAVIPSHQNPWNENNAKAKGAPSSGTSNISIAVNADGQLLDSVLVKAGRKGRAPELFRTMRKGSGVTLGFDRGNFAPKSR